MHCDSDAGEFSFSAPTLLVGWQEGHPVCKNGCWFVGGDDLTGKIWLKTNFARLTAPVVTTTSITLSSSKVQNRDVLVPANPDPAGKWQLKRTERQMDEKYGTQGYNQLQCISFLWVSLETFFITNSELILEWGEERLGPKGREWGWGFCGGDSQAIPIN